MQIKQTVRRGAQGFTIVELMVSMTIFVILIGVVVGIFIASLRTQRTVSALMAANDNVSLALEQVAREVRTGVDFCIAKKQGVSWVCDASVTSGSALSFENAYGGRVVYLLEDETFKRSNNGGATFGSITSRNVVLAALAFRLVHLDLGAPGNWPPRVTITMKVGSHEDPQRLGSVFTSMQTTVSGREL